jgi:hypothetical protein
VGQDHCAIASLAGRDSLAPTHVEKRKIVQQEFSKEEEEGLKIPEKNNNGIGIAEGDCLNQDTINPTNITEIERLLGTQSAISSQDLEEKRRCLELIQQIKNITNMCQDSHQTDSETEGEDKRIISEQMETELLDLEDDFELNLLFENNNDALLNDSMEIETGTEFTFAKPIVKVATKENSFQNNKTITVTETAESLGDANSTPYIDSAASCLSGRSTPSAESSKSTQAMPESALEPGELSTSPLSRKQELLRVAPEKALTCDKTLMVSLVGGQEIPYKRRTRTPEVAAIRKVWVTPETMLQVKRAIRQEMDGHTCTICNWKGTHKRARVHVKQHYIRYACPCGLMKVSRDVIYDHQISKQKSAEPGHGSRAGEIFEIDQQSFPEFAAQREWPGATTFPDLPPTTTGIEQHNRQAKSARCNAAKGKMPARQSRPTSPAHRVAPIRTPSPPPTTTDLSQKIRSRQQPTTRRFTIERDRRAAEMVSEAARLDQVALDLYRQSRRQPHQSDEYLNLRRQARETEQEAAHYRRCARDMRDHL